MFCTMQAEASRWVLKGGNRYQGIKDCNMPAMLAKLQSNEGPEAEQPEVLFHIPLAL